MIYDFEIDNTNLSIEETAQKIKLAYENTSNPIAFKNFMRVLRDKTTQN